MQSADCVGTESVTANQSWSHCFSGTLQAHSLRAHSCGTDSVRSHEFVIFQNWRPIVFQQQLPHNFSFIFIWHPKSLLWMLGWLGICWVDAFGVVILEYRFTRFNTSASQPVLSDQIWLSYETDIHLLILFSVLSVLLIWFSFGTKSLFILLSVNENICQNLVDIIFRVIPAVSCRQI